jgi:hypothetical protein
MEKNARNNNFLTTDAGIEKTLAWLSVAHKQPDAENTEELLKHVSFLRDTSLPSVQRTQLLDLLAAHTERAIRQELQTLRDISLPVSRKTRLRIKLMLELLEALTQDYANTFPALLDPGKTAVIPQTALRRAIMLIAWQIRLYHLIAAPPRQGLWHQLHSCFRTARHAGLAQQPGPRNTPSIQRLYLNAILCGIAQPASFSASELEFINTLMEHTNGEIGLSETLTEPAKSTFWIDPDRDLPAHALIRRLPGSDLAPLYFSCTDLVKHLATLRRSLTGGTPPETLSLPEFAGTRLGQGVLRRLEALWGEPAKRKFPRRRQSHRVRLHTGLDAVHKLLANEDTGSSCSEWMVTNESPDGFALMHVAGDTMQLRVGDIAAMQAHHEPPKRNSNRLICMIRWAISENPEHIEIGLQVLAPDAIATHIAQPANPELGKLAALILPETPPLRTAQSLVVPPGLLTGNTRKIVALVEQHNLLIREIRTTQLDEQTSSLEIFSVQSAHDDDEDD